MQSLSIDKKLSDLPLAITMGEPGGINSEIFFKAIKEVKYHLRHSKNWLLRLGDGTSISNKKVQNALRI